MPTKQKGHWPKGKRRNGGDPTEIKRLLDIAASRREMSKVARRLGINRKNLYRYWSGKCAPPTGLTERIAAILKPV